MNRITRLTIEIVPYIEKSVYITFKRENDSTKMWTTSPTNKEDIKETIDWSIEQFVGTLNGKIRKVGRLSKE